ncbi:MAG: biotin--[acetyl-CoA-carboxylase] ligase [Crocinitomicaceae bacterium]
MMEIGRKIIHLDSVDSTNNYTANLVRENNIGHGTVILADEQFAGRGQRASEWVVKPGENLTFTVFLDNVNVAVVDQFVLTQIVSLSLVEVLSQFNLNPEIKWPNDIFVNGKKIAGVLIENQLKSNLIKSSIIGIGLNVNQTDFYDFIATSVKAELNEFKNVKDMLYSFVFAFNKTWNNYIGDLNLLDTDYHANLFQRGVEAHYEDDQGPFIGVLNGVLPSGRLLIEKEGTELNYDLKEIKFIPRNAL